MMTKLRANAPLFAAALLALCAALAYPCLAQVEKPPAEYKASGSFSGGTSSEGMVLSGIRFGKYEAYTRMVLDLHDVDERGNRSGASTHPVYSISYLEHPYHLVIRMLGVEFGKDAKIQSSPALPFSVVTPESGMIKEMQVFLAGPSEFKVIEIDDPAKLCIDIKPRKGVEVPTVFTVQLMGIENAQQAYAIVEKGGFPAGYNPGVLVLGETVVVEQVFFDSAEAAQMDSALREMGFSAMINERLGNELPQM